MNVSSHRSRHDCHAACLYQFFEIDGLVASLGAFAAELFQPLDPDILNASIPTFFVGRDRDGFWLIRDVKGENGGIFLLKSSALAFARKLAGPFGCATVLSPERVELDLENQGNPLINLTSSRSCILRRQRSGRITNR